MKYSHPGLFREEWAKSCARRHEMALTAKQERRQQQKKDRIQLQAAQTADSPVNESVVMDSNEQKRLKFLRIRSWKEIYGTGEGRELMQAPQVKNSSLLSQTRKSKKSISVPINEEKSRILPPLLMTVPEKRQSLTSSQPGTPTTIVCSGAFMQEMDEDEMNESDSAIVHDLDAVNGYQSRQSSTFETGEPSQEFADHGLSYYDPRLMCSPPPPPLPPPPPPLSDFSTIDLEPQEKAYYDVPMEADFDQPPPPPPPPPPLPLSEMIESRAFAVPPTSLLHEIHKGASLRHIQVLTVDCLRATRSLY